MVETLIIQSTDHWISRKLIALEAGRPMIRRLNLPIGVKREQELAYVTVKKQFRKKMACSSAQTEEGQDRDQGTRDVIWA